MLEKSPLPVLLFVCLMMVPMVALAGGPVATVVSITGTVDQFAEWAPANQTIAAADFDNHINGVNQTRTASNTFKLYMNNTLTLTPTTDAGKNLGVLTDGSAHTLTTKYKLNCAAMAAGGDAAYKLAAAGVGEFFNAGNTYTVTHAAGTGSYDVTLWVQMLSPVASAPDAGNYTCGLTLTATW